MKDFYLKWICVPSPMRKTKLWNIFCVLSLCRSGLIYKKKLVSPKITDVILNYSVLVFTWLIWLYQFSFYHWVHTISIVLSGDWINDSKLFFMALKMVQSCRIACKICSYIIHCFSLNFIYVLTHVTMAIFMVLYGVMCICVYYMHECMHVLMWIYLCA